jgi:hypothetical protein
MISFLPYNTFFPIQDRKKIKKTCKSGTNSTGETGSISGAVLIDFGRINLEPGKFLVCQGKKRSASIAREV